MAKSKAKKQRDHLIRTGKRDVTSSRGPHADFSTHVRKTKTKVETVRKEQIKHKKRFLQDYRDEGDAFLILCFTSIKRLLI